MYTSKLLAAGTAAILCLGGFSSPSWASPSATELPGESEQHTTELVSLAENSGAGDQSPTDKLVDATANSGRFRNYKGRIIDTKDYIRARY